MEELCLNIVRRIKDVNPDIIYFAVGCSMEHYNNCDINSNNNQQNPYFLQKFEKSKTVSIFFDPELENPLKLETQIKLIETYSSDVYYRILENDNIILFAINKSFNFYSNKHELPRKYTTFEIMQTFIASLIFYCIKNKKKLIVQDYTGTDINNAYLDFFEFFSTTELIKYVIFDITQNDGGCFIDFSKKLVHYDTEENFIQPKFMTLSNLKKLDNDIFKIMLNKRINWLNYYISRQIRIINKEIEDCQYYNKEIEYILKNLSIIYSNTTEISIENLKNTIIFVMVDIIEALELSPKILTYISDNNYTQKIINDILSICKNVE